MPGKNTILLAEDEEGDVLLLDIALSRTKLGTKLLVTRNGQQAVEYLLSLSRDQAATRPGLLLLDLKMPCMSGFDVLEWLGSHPEFNDIPAIVLTSSTNDSDREKATAMGAREYLVKPTGIQELSSLVRGVCERHISL